MIAHISPASIYFEESRNTLNYADRAKYIKTKVRRFLFLFLSNRSTSIIDSPKRHRCFLSHRSIPTNNSGSSSSSSTFARTTRRTGKSIDDEQWSAFFAFLRCVSEKTKSSNSFFSLSFVFQDNLNNDRHKYEENFKLRENILQSYQKQIQVRRSLLELDCALVDVYHELSRNETIVEK